MGNKNTFAWDVAAWRSDSKVTALSPLARGIYRELLDSIHELDHSGVITGTREELARHGRCPVVELIQTIEELKKHDTCGVTERNGVVTLVNRRLQRECEQREKCRKRVEQLRAKRETRNAKPALKRNCNASGNAVVTPPPCIPLSKSDKENPDKALSSLSSYKSTEGRGSRVEAGRVTPCAPSKSKPKTRNSKLTEAQRELALRFEIVLGHQWPNDAGKWVNRIKSEFNKTERVLAEVESATKENRILETPAQYAEQIWKEFR